MQHHLQIRLTLHFCIAEFALVELTGYKLTLDILLETKSIRKHKNNSNYVLDFIDFINFIVKMAENVRHSKQCAYYLG